MVPLSGSPAMAFMIWGQFCSFTAVACTDPPQACSNFFSVFRLYGPGLACLGCLGAFTVLQVSSGGQYPVQLQGELVATMPEVNSEQVSSGPGLTIASQRQGSPSLCT